MLISEMLQIVELNTERKVTHAIVSVPTFFKNSQKLAMLDACAIAGLEDYDLITEGAAAVAYGFDSQQTDVRTILVVDIGAGPFDAVGMNIEKEKFQASIVSGDAHF